LGSRRVVILSRFFSNSRKVTATWRFTGTMTPSCGQAGVAAAQLQKSSIEAT